MGRTNGVRFTAKMLIFLFAIAFRSSVLPRPPIQWIPQFFSPEAKRTERGAEYPYHARLWRGALLIRDIK